MLLYGRYGVIKVAHWFLIFAFRDSISEVDCNIGVYSGIGHCFADPYKLFSVLHSLTRQVLYRRFTSIVSHSQGLVDSATPFSFSWEPAISTCLSGGSIMSITAPRSQLSSSWPAACSLNPDTRVKIPDAMRIKGYSNVEAANQSLQQQVRREAEKLKGEAIPCPPAPVAAAASALMALSAIANVGRPALRTILPNPATIVAPFVTVGGGKAGILPSPERRVRKTSHQARIRKQNERVTSNDMLIAVELNQRNAEVAEREKEKKSRVEYHARREAALPIVDRLQNDLGDDIGQLKSKDLEVLIRWKDDGERC